MESLHRQMGLQSPEENHRLSVDLLHIVTAREEPIEKRFRACHILGARRRELGLCRSAWITREVRKVLEEEFVTHKRAGLFLMWKRSGVKDMNIVRFCLFETLLATLLRIDMEANRKYVWQITDLAVHSKFGTVLRDLMSGVERQLATE